MEFDIHPLQDASVSLLLSLYRDSGLPTTSAMLSVLNGYYPSVSDIIKTIKHYKDQTDVIEFSRANAVLIKDAEDSLNPTPPSEDSVLDDGVVGGLFSDFNFKITKAYDSLKSVPLNEVESVISEALTRLCGENLSVEIDLLKRQSFGINNDAEIRLRVGAGKSQDNL